MRFLFQKLGYRIVRESGHLILSNGERRLVIPLQPTCWLELPSNIARRATLSRTLRKGSRLGD